MKNIVLTGLRGSGKTSLGKVLAKKLKWDFIDMDELIEKQEKMKISEIVEKHGWEHFRNLEKEAAAKIGQMEKTIISTGGGTIIDPENEKSLKQNGRIIYLYRSPEDCLKHTKDDPNRPSLTNSESKLQEMEIMYKKRNGRYCQSAFRVLHRTENLEKDAEELLSILSLS